MAAFFSAGIGLGAPFHHQLILPLDLQAAAQFAQFRKPLRRRRIERRLHLIAEFACLGDKVFSTNVIYMVFAPMLTGLLATLAQVGQTRAYGRKAVFAACGRG